MHRQLRCAIEIDAPVDRAFALWTRYESLPRLLESVRRTKIIDDRRVLWDVDIGGQQLVWEARILALEPDTRIRWESTWGTPNRGELCFERLLGERARMTVSIDYGPRGLLEHIGARLGLVDWNVRRDLERFRRFAESPAGRAEAARRAAQPARGLWAGAR